ETCLQARDPGPLSPVGADTVPAESEPAPLCVDELLDWCANDVKIVRLALDKFEEQLVADRQALQQSTSENSLRDVARIAHALKGAAGMVSAQRLLELATRLEDTALTATREALGDLQKAVDAEIRRCLEFLPTARAA